MKVEKVKLTIGKTINLGNYESARVEVGGEILLDGDTPEKGYAKLKGICQAELDEQIKEQKAIGRSV